MKRSRAAKAESGEGIVSAAARLFRSQGLLATSIADVMHAAKLTHGGFYRHFASKEALVAAATAEAFRAVTAELTEAPASSSTDSAERFIERYMSEEHINSAGDGCPIVALGSESSRGGGDLSQVFADGIERFVRLLAQRFPGTERTQRKRAARLLASMVGAVLIARATGNASVGREIVAACLEAARGDVRPRG